MSYSPNLPTGSGAVYSFDPVGSYEREACRAAGAAQSLVQPFLDNQVRVLCAPSYRHRLTDRLPTSTRYRASYRYTSRTRLLRSASRTQRIFLYLTCSPSLSTRLRVRRSATSRYVPQSRQCGHVQSLRVPPQVGDGLEIYVVVAKGRSPQGLDGTRGVQELSAKADGDRTFVIRRELKKD